jgi:amino acid transporter
MTAPQQLQKGLKQRHLTMIAIGGVIGAGLFVGSGVVINQTGRAAFLTYLDHRCADHPGDADARRDGHRQPLHRVVRRLLAEELSAAGRASRSAWLYWYFWVIVVGFEAVAGAKILTSGSTPALAAVAQPHGADDRDEPGLGELLRRVRVLVRRHQGRSRSSPSSCSARRS